MLYAQINSAITPAQVDLLDDAIGAAMDRDAKMLLIRLDTPGGLVESMRRMVKSILNSPVPIAIWVGPAGAHAASAGVFLVAASNVAGMSPQATMGAASPVAMQGKEIPETLARKVKNDLLSLIRGVVAARGRNMEWYAKAIEESVSITGTEAVMLKVVEYASDSPADLLVQAGTRGVHHHDRIIRFRQKDTQLLPYEPGMRYRFLAWLLHPQVAYLLLMGGMAGLFFELTNPGALLPGVLGGLCLLLGLYALSVLPTNVAGILLILFGLVLFLLEIKITSYGLLTISALVSLFVGSMILFKMEGGMTGLPLSTVIVTVVGVGLLVGWAVLLVGKAHRNRPVTGADGLIDRTGQVRQWQGTAGTIFVHGELWSARSETAMDFLPGDMVRVTGLDGLTCLVSSKAD